MGFSVDAGFAAGEIQSCYVVTGGAELGKCSATTALGIIRMSADAEDLECG